MGPFFDALHKKSHARVSVDGNQGSGKRTWGAAFRLGFAAVALTCDRGGKRRQIVVFTQFKVIKNIRRDLGLPAVMVSKVSHPV